MALGGGIFTTQNKKLPGAYINFVSAARASTNLSDRGICALPMALNWGPENEVITIESGEFFTNSLRILGYDYASDECLPFRELFKHAKTAYIYNLHTGSVKASNEFCTAKYGGDRGNDLEIVITPNVDAPDKFDVKTLLDNVVYDEQKSVTSAAELKNNDYVVFKPDATLKLTASTPLTGGSNTTKTPAVAASCKYGTAKTAGVIGNSYELTIVGTTGSWDISLTSGDNELFSKTGYDKDTIVAADLTNDYVEFNEIGLSEETAIFTGGKDASETGAITVGAWQKALGALESYSFNTLGIATNDDYVKSLAAAYTKRMRDEVGIKFQTVVFDYTANDKSVINAVNGLTGDATDPSVVYWITGAQCGCRVYESLTNQTYDGELPIDVSRTQTQLEACVDNGEFVLHRVGDEIRVLTDINSKTSVSAEEGNDFKSNQTMRVLDQIGNDIAALFNDRFLGKVPNDEAGRISLWNEIVKHHQELARIRAIEEFDPENVTVAAGDEKNAVVVNDLVTPTNALEKLYMTVTVA